MQEKPHLIMRDGDDPDKMSCYMVELVNGDKSEFVLAFDNGNDHAAILARFEPDVGLDTAVATIMFLQSATVVGGSDELKKVLDSMTPDDGGIVQP